MRKDYRDNVIPWLSKNAFWLLMTLPLCLLAFATPAPKISLVRGLIAADTINPVKKYCVSLPLTDWVKSTNYIEYVKQTLRQTDLPAKQASYLIDSLLVPFQQQIADQINAQIKADSAKKK